jgi:predicted metal-dependent hydrolase
MTEFDRAMPDKIDTPTPKDLKLVVRDERFNRQPKQGRWWVDGDPVATTWMIALSSTFPRGEAFFIDAVKAHRDGVPPELAEEIRAFIKQEVNHTREHVAFNRAAEKAGYDLTEIDKQVERVVGEAMALPPIARLAMTMALEHFTAMLGHQLLTRPQLLANTDDETANLWYWHALEEIEHKGVAYDTWLHATQDWSGWKRWKIRSLLMLSITFRFIKHRVRNTLDLLEQDGISRTKGSWKLTKYLLVSPGFLRLIFPQWLAYFKPGFHPWDLDDRYLIGRTEGDYRAALMPAE